VGTHVMIKIKTCIQAHKNGTQLAISADSRSLVNVQSKRLEATHVDILKPAALYTAARTNPTAAEQTRARAAPNADHTTGIRNTGHIGKGFLGLLIFWRGSVGSDGRRRKMVRDKREVVKHAIEHRNRIAPNSIKFQ